MSKKLSVIIVTYNSENHIYGCLESVFKYNDIGDALEVIVVDNNSMDFDHMKCKLEALYGDLIRIISNSSNEGYGQGNNIGIRYSMAPYFAIMNPDVRLTMPIFSAMIDCLANENVAMCAGKQMGRNMRPLESFRSSVLMPIWFRIFVQYICQYKLDCYLYKYMWLQGAFFAMKKVVFEQIGMFDEKIFLYFEEEDIHYRLKRIFPNMKCVYLKQYQYIHCADNREYSEKKMMINYKSMAYFFEKNTFDVAVMLQNEIKYNNAYAKFACISDALKRRRARELHTRKNNMLLSMLIRKTAF